LPIEQRDNYARVRQDGFDGWARRDSLSQPGTEPPPIDNRVLTADGREGVKLGDRVFTNDELAALATRAAAEDIRKATLPADPSAYRLDLPADLVLPKGVEIKFAENDPILGPVINQARSWAHANGFSQEQFSSMLGLYAGSVAHERAQFNEAVQREINALGPAASTRLDAVQSWLRAEVGEEHARAMLPMIVSAKIVEGFERMANKRSGNVGSFARANSEPPPSPGLSDAQYAAMSGRERMQYARDASAAAAAAPPPRGGRA
jgi:hypothetical protein